MDGVITDTMPYHFKVWKDLFAIQGINVTREDIYSREGQKGIESIKEIFNKYQKPFDLGTANQLLLKKEAVFKRIFKRKFIAGARPFLNALSMQSIRLALVTGTSRDEVVHLLPKKLFDLFEVTVCGCDVQLGKPHPEPYLKALAGLSLAPDQVIVIENAPFGVRSAKAAGLRCGAITTSLPKEFLHEADFVVKDFKELRQRIILR